MEGRKHLDTARKQDQARRSKIEGTSGLEAELEAGQRKHVVPPQYTVGGGGPRAGSSAGDDADEAELQGQDTLMSGADVAPTAKAQERERARHALEREMGRAPAGHDGQLKAHGAEGLDREDLADAAARADEQVAGHPLNRKTH